jgi:hypothetical protein
MAATVAAITGLALVSLLDQPRSESNAPATAR